MWWMWLLTGLAPWSGVPAQQAAPQAAPPTAAPVTAPAAAPVLPSLMSIEQIDLRALPRVAVRVLVGTKGRYLGGLLARDLRVTLSGAPADSVTLAAAGSTKDSSTVVLVVDQSALGFENERRTRTLITEFTERMRSNDRVAVLGAGDWVESLVELTSPVQAPRSIQSLSAYGTMPMLWQAVESAVTLAANTGAPRRYVVVVSASATPDTSRTVQETAAQAVARGVPVFTVALGASADTAALRALAVATGGRAFQSPQGTGAPSAYAAIATQIESEYVLQFVVPPRVRESAVQLELGVVTPFEGWRREELQISRAFLATRGIGIDAGTLRARERAGDLRDGPPLMLLLAGVTLLCTVLALVTLRLAGGAHLRVLLAVLGVLAGTAALVVGLLFPSA
jgi:hypothetical protein